MTLLPPRVAARYRLIVTRTADQWTAAFRTAANVGFEMDRQAVMGIVQGFERVTTATVEDVEAYFLSRSRQRWRAAMRSPIRQTASTTLRALDRALPLKQRPLPVPMEEWFGEYELAFANQLSSTSLRELRELLEEAMLAGKAGREIENALEALFVRWKEGGRPPEDVAWAWKRMPDFRREMISRTEAMRASNYAALFRYQEAGITHKEWDATEDARLCPFCAEMDGKVLVVDETFFELGQSLTVVENGQERTMDFTYEDVSAPPLHPNCRCVLLPWEPMWAEV